VIIQ